MLPDENVLEGQGILVMRRWLFAKQQETFYDEDSACIHWLFSQVRQLLCPTRPGSLFSWVAVHAYVFVCVYAYVPPSVLTFRSWC